MLPSAGADAGADVASTTIISQIGEDYLHLVPVIILITCNQLNLLSALKALYFYGAAGED